MNTETLVSIRLLQDEIQSKFGRSISYAHDCDELSLIIKNQTHRQVSCSTLKRFFGIIKSPFSLSNYTLDTLSIFLNYQDWHEFHNNYEQGKFNYLHRETAGKFRQEIDAITCASLKSLKKTHESLINIPLRSFAEKKFDQFLNSPKIATAFIAPEGFGKSTIIIQLTEKFFTDKDAKYPDDIVALVDGAENYNLIVHHKKINQLDLIILNDSGNTPNSVLNSEYRLFKGRFILIINNLDDIFAQNNHTDYQIRNLTEILTIHAKHEWFKTLITCSPTLWRQISSQILKNQFLKSCWFDGAFKGSDEELINIPPLKKREIQLILEKNHYSLSISELSFNYPDIPDLINIPQLMKLFLTTSVPAPTDAEVDLLLHFISTTLLSPLDDPDRYSVLQSYFVLCANGKSSLEIKKCDLNLSPPMLKAYNALIRRGVLYEVAFEEPTRQLLYVKFSRNVTFTHYLTNMLIDENKLNIEFLRDHIIEYSNIPRLQAKILSYIIKLLFKNQEIELLKNIFLIHDPTHVPDVTASFDRIGYMMANVIGLEMRKNHKLREILVPYYASCAAGRALYFEKYFDVDRLVLDSGNELDHYLSNSQTDEDKLYVYYMKFMQYFLSEKREMCAKALEQIIFLGYNEGKCVLQASYYFIPQVIFQSVYGGKVEDRLMTEIYRLSEKFLTGGIQSRTELPDFEFSIIFALNFGGMNHEIIRLSHYIYETYDLTNSVTSCFYMLFLAVYAKALLETGETLVGADLFHQVRSKSMHFPLNMKYYFHIRYMLIAAEFMIHHRKLIKAHLQLEKIKNISAMLKFSYFTHSAAALEKSIIALS